MLQHFGGRFRTGNVELPVRLENQLAVGGQLQRKPLCHPRFVERRFEAGHTGVSSQPDLSCRFLCTKTAKIATSAGVTPEIRPAKPSVRGRWRANFSLASRES